MYNDVIAKLTGQDLAKQEIMYKLHENTNFVYEVIGETGSGKTTLIDCIKNNWKDMTKGVVLSLCAPNYIPANDYDVFKKLIVEKEQNTEIIKNILVESFKDIPYVGNSLSTITSELLDSQSKRSFSSDNEAKEEMFIKKISSCINGKKALFLCYDFEKWDFKSRNLFINIISQNKIKNANGNIYFLIESTQKVFSGNIQEHKIFSLKKIDLDNITDIIKIFPKNE